jgi:AraC-like DNA-binding protein
MDFVFENRASDSPLVEWVWRTQSDQPGSFISAAVTSWEMVIMRQYGKTYFTVRGPETKASLAPIPPDAEFFGIVFKLGTFMPHLPNSALVDNPVNLPEASTRSIWLNGAAWQIPDFENADTFIQRMTRQGMLAHDPVIDAVLQGRPHDLSIRTVRRRFLRATGLTHGEIVQIERARRAQALLQQGVPILDTVYEAGFYDQPHLTRALKRLVGQTPAQILPALNLSAALVG